MANHPAAPLELREGDRPQLVAMTRSPTVRAGLAQRARILLLAADGLSNTEIADKVGVSRPTVLMWRERYVEEGIDGLIDKARPGRRPRAAAPDVLAATMVAPPRRLGVTHWSSRLLGDELGIGRGTVVRAWHEYGVQPVRGGFRIAATPTLAGRVIAVLALRLGAPENIAVLDVREPARVADRADNAAVADALPGLTAALRRTSPAPPDDPAGALLGFLDDVNRARSRWPTASRLHLVTDGTGPIGLPALREALAVRSRITVHTVREPARWPDMLVGWLAMAARGIDGPPVLPAFDRVRRTIAPGEVFAWTHTPGQGVGGPGSPSPVYPTVK
jgi:transposase